MHSILSRDSMLTVLLLLYKYWHYVCGNVVKVCTVGYGWESNKIIQINNDGRTGIRIGYG